MNKPLFLLTTLTLTTVLAQGTATKTAADKPTSEKRIVKIEGAPTGNLRTGPLTFTGSPLNATVSSLKVQSLQAVLAAPAGIPITNAKGKRTATFNNKISVNRGRLTAKGDRLVYSEATGEGILTGSASAVFTPAKAADGDPVNITAGQMSLDVDNNVSTSTGEINLVSGNQTAKAAKLVFDEDRELAQFTGNPTLTKAASGNGKALTISGDEIRALTKSKTLYVKGKVKLVQGSTTTTGDAVYYDDKNNIAYVVGNASSVDSKSGTTISAPASGYLEQRTNFGRVSSKNSSFTIPADQFKLRTEK